MNVILYFCLTLLTISGGFVMVRMVIGPSEPDRAVTADMLFATTTALFIVFGLLFEFRSMLDLLLVAASAGFLSSLALVRLILRDEQ